MPELEPSSFDWPQATADGRARARALDALRARAGTTAPAAVVTYRSAGRVLVIGSADAAAAVLPDLQGLDPVVLCPEAHDPPRSGRWITGTVRIIEGYLGAFTVTAATAEGETNPARRAGEREATFDLVLDLQPRPALEAEKPPPGYFASRGDESLGRELAAGLPGWIGDFDKPRYFDFDAGLCAHGRRGLAGCRRCLDACAAEAIRSAGEHIEIDPYLCQGCGSCATVCPTGAVAYAYPPADDLLDIARGALRTYFEAGGRRPCVVLHDDAAGAERVAAAAAGLPERALAVAVEDVGAIGPEAWLSLLAFGAESVFLLAAPDTPERELKATRDQIDALTPMLDALGLAGDRVRLLGVDADLAAVDEPAPRPEVPAATFGAFGTKRDVLGLALAHLVEHAPPDRPTAVSLPAQAPFGTVHVDREACTLCMACVSVCPSMALTGGGGEPRLLLREDRCVQCGLCEKACPEDAVALEARMDFRAHTAPRAVILNEEELFHCEGCGKPFGTRKMMERMAAKLAGHWMFQDERARRRLRLCENCRVKDMFGDDGGVRTRKG